MSTKVCLLNHLWRYRFGSKVLLFLASKILCCLDAKDDVGGGWNGSDLLFFILNTSRPVVPCYRCCWSGCRCCNLDPASDTLLLLLLVVVVLLLLLPEMKPEKGSTSCGFLGPFHAGPNS